MHKDNIAVASHDDINGPNLVVKDTGLINSHIFSSSVSLNNPIKGLLNICALYLLQNDLQTAGLVVKELKAYENNLEHCADVAFLISFYYVKRVRIRGWHWPIG